MRTSRKMRRRTLTVVLVASVAAVPVLMIVALPAVPGCGSGDALGLEDWQRDLLFGFGSLAIGLLNSGAAGPAGQPGLACWDLNGNGVGDPAEDINGDGVFDALDCQGAPGVPSPVPDEPGQPVPSVPGEPGTPGLSCWDLNGDGIQDADEDVNGDGVFDALDCQGAEGPAGGSGGSGGSGPPGAPGDPGEPGLACWDKNGNGVCDEPSEDKNCDGVCDAHDCQVDSLFNVFIDEFYTVEANPAYGALELPEFRIVRIVEPALGSSCCFPGNECCPKTPADAGLQFAQENECVEVTAYKTPIPQGYMNNNPVTMRLFFWRTGCSYTDGCFVFRIDSFMTRHGTGIQDMSPGGRYVKTILPDNVNECGMLLVVDLPLDNEKDLTVEDPDGLGLEPILDELHEADFLAFELNRWEKYDDGGCYTLLGVEFFESFPCPGTVQTVHAKIYKDPEDIDCPDIPECRSDDDCVDDDPCTIDTCNLDGVCEHEPDTTDEDADCVLDCLDQCLDTPEWYVVDADGCTCLDYDPAVDPDKACVECGDALADIVLMLDRTGSVNDDERQAEEDAANDLLQLLHDSGMAHSVAIGRFGLDGDVEDPDAEIVQPLLDVSDGGNLATLQAAVTSAMASHSGFGTRIYDAIHVGQDELAGGGNPIKVLILISDGENVPVRGVTPPIHVADANDATTAVANAAKDAGTLILTIAFGASGDGDDVGHRALLAGWATQPSADDQSGGDAVTQAEADAENADGDFFYISLDPVYAGLQDVFTMIANTLGGMSICSQNGNVCTENVCVPPPPGLAAPAAESVCVEMYEDIVEDCVFTDDFNRDDSDSVGNNWDEDEFEIDDAAISGHRLLLMGGSEDDGDPDAAVTQMGIDATGMTDVTLSYLWRKLNDESEGADSLIVEWRACGEVDFLLLATHSLGAPIPAWAYQSVDLPASCVDIRFRLDVSYPDEGALIENVKVCGTLECPGRKHCGSNP